MNDGHSPLDWAKDFERFATVKELTPPPMLSAGILEAVYADLKPAVWRVFAKLGLVQLVVGAFVIMICPQFGYSIIPGMGLMALFMRFGELPCMMGCGAVFLGASSLLGSLLLRPEELRVIHGSRLLQLGVMVLLSSSVFICLGGEMIVSLGLGWVVGGLIGGLGTLELGWVLRVRFQRMYFEK